MEKAPEVEVRPDRIDILLYGSTMFISPDMVPGISVILDTEMFTLFTWEKPIGLDFMGYNSFLAMGLGVWTLMGSLTHFVGPHRACFTEF